MPPKKVPKEQVQDTKKTAPTRKRSEPIDIPKKAVAAPVRKPRARKPKADEELARKISELIDSHFAK